MTPDEIEGGLAGFLEGDGGGGDLLEEATARVHLADELVHGGKLFGAGRDHQVGALFDDDELVVGHQSGDLEDDVPVDIEAAHLEIHPHQHAETLAAVAEAAKGRWRQRFGTRPRHV